MGKEQRLFALLAKQEYDTKMKQTKLMNPEIRSDLYLVCPLVQFGLKMRDITAVDKMHSHVELKIRSKSRDANGIEKWNKVKSYEFLIFVGVATTLKVHLFHVQGSSVTLFKRRTGIVPVLVHCQGFEFCTCR